MSSPASAPQLIHAWDSWRGAIDCALSDRTWLAAELRAESEQLASQLAQGGVRSGDIVGIALCNSAAFPVALFALLRMGCNPVLLFAGTRAAEVVRTADELGMTRFVHDFADGVSQVEPSAFTTEAKARVAGSGLTLLNTQRTSPPAIEGNGLIVHATSGTYGAAHFCIRNQHAAVAEGRNCIDTVTRPAGARIRVTTPLSHSYAYGFGFVSALLSDGVLVVEPYFNPRRLLRREHQCRSGITLIVPPMAKSLASVRTGRDCAVGRAVFYAGAPCPQAVMEEFSTAFGQPLFAVYGTTETGAISTNHAAPGTHNNVGRALRNVEVLFLHHDRYASLGNGAGEIHVRTSSLMQGYVSAGANGIPDPWPTGDIGYADADGNIVIVGRIKDIINLGGMKVDPRDVESVLLQHENVSDAAVYPGLREDGSEFVQAAIHLHEKPADIESIRRHCLDRLDAHKVPLRFHIVDAIPRTPSGKCLKVQCPAFPRALLVR